MVASLLALAACNAEVNTTKQLNTEKGEDIISEFMEENYKGLTVGEVKCPEREIKEGDVFTCTGELNEQTLKFDVTQTDDEGTIEAEPTQAVLDISAAKALVEKSVGEQNQTTVTADCGSEDYVVSDVGSTLECEFTDAQGEGGTVVATVTDVEGSVDLTLK